MDISIIVAMGHNRVIGYQNAMPWHMPADLAHFKQLTLNKPILMGRKTFESIGCPLPKRRNMVLSKTWTSAPPGVEVFASMEAALKAVSEESQLMCIGGSVLFTAMLPLASTLYLTEIDADFPGDTFFPEWQTFGTFDCVKESAHEPDAKNPYPYRFLTLKRV